MPTFRPNPVSFDRRGDSIRVRMAGAARNLDGGRRDQARIGMPKRGPEGTLPCSPSGRSDPMFAHDLPVGIAGIDRLPGVLGP